LALQAGPWDLGDGLRSLSGEPLLRPHQGAGRDDPATNPDAATGLNYDLDSYSYSDANPDPNSDADADAQASPEDLLHLDSAGSSDRERVSLHGYGHRELGIAGDADA
jgi:hypothetical protein